MEPDASVETSSMIRVAVLPIAAIPPHLFQDYAAMLHRHHTVSLNSISSFYTEHQKSPFSHQPWDSGSLRFKFMLGGSPPSPWEDFQSNRKILVVIGLCHCPSSPDLLSVANQFTAACKSYSSSLVQRCFAFCPGDSQLEEESIKGSKIVLFPPADRQTQEFHLQTMVQDIAASLLMEFEKWVLQAESGGTIFKTPLDSQASLSSEEVIKAKKRRLGRAQKTIGDYCLLAGSPVDANAHYSTALELTRLTADFFWYAGAMEGSVCSLLIDRKGQTDPILEDEVKYRYNSVILHYRKSFIQDNAQSDIFLFGIKIPPVVSPLSFELEATLKLARFICRRELAKEVVELLTAAADGATSLIDVSDKLIVYVEIARLFGALGYHRKAAFFSRQVAQLYLQQDNRLAATSAMQVLAMTTKAYRVQSRASSEPSKDNRQNYADGEKMHHHSIVSLFESQWSTLQMVVLREILLSAIRAGDPLAAWSAAARLLRSYYPLITPAGQSGLASALKNSAVRLPLGIRCGDPALPFIRLHSFPLHPSQMDIVQRNPAREDWWLGSAPSGPFIYTPFSKGVPNHGDKQELTWVVGEPVQVLVELANPCGFEVMVDSIYLSVHSKNLDAFPVSVNLQPNSSKMIALSGIPTDVGPVSISGCIVHCFGVITEHFFMEVDNLLIGATQGLVLCDPFRSCGAAKLKNAHVPNISVVLPLPLLVSHVVGGDTSVMLYEGEIRDVRISLANAGTVPVEEAHISFSGKNQDSIVSVDLETLNSALPLKPGAEVMICVTLKAWQLGITDPGTSAKQVKDANSPMLVIHYAGPVINPEEPEAGSVLPPGRRLVIPLNICVFQGLSFVKARLLSMEIPAHGEICTKLAQLELDAATKQANGSENQTDRGSWGLRLLELELSNPTDVVFETSVSLDMDKHDSKDSFEFGDPKTRIGKECTARVLIPLKHFKLPVLDGSSFLSSPSCSFSEKDIKAELNASTKNLISRIKVRWQSGRNSSGELDIKDAVQVALQASVMSLLLPDPLTFGFRLIAKSSSSDHSSNAFVSGGGSVNAHDMTAIQVLVRNNTNDTVKIDLSITCKDVAGRNCIDGDKATVLWEGVLDGNFMEVPPLEEIKHIFSLYFLIPGEYTVLASAVISDANEVLRARAKTHSSNDPIFCRGPPFHVRVYGTA
ncbi:hypothetical protein CASFOL_007061 [Castilleja foliolosa]|uniref:Trafficking protein particle complex II-specific subunit 120 homolog n=1 Tax=Castilleja foliolosa TaxID=1961234 RepID=A0ABD3E8J0_9LAMI